MASTQLEPLEIATDWIREYARTCIASELAFEFSEDDLKSHGLGLLDILELFRDGVVVVADKFDSPGGYWVVEGVDAEGRLLSATVIVLSESLTVRLLGIDIVNKG